MNYFNPKNPSHHLIFTGIDVGFGEVDGVFLKNFIDGPDEVLFADSNIWKDKFVSGVTADAGMGAFGVNTAISYNGKNMLYDRPVTSMVADKSSTEDMLIQTLASIARRREAQEKEVLLSQIGERANRWKNDYDGRILYSDVIMGFGMPVKSYLDKDLRQDYMTYFSQYKDKDIEFEHNGIRHIVRFLYLSCYPQGYGYTLTIDVEGEYLIFDLGSNTFDCCHVMNDLPVQETILSEPYGINHLITAIAEKLKPRDVLSTNMIIKAITGEEFRYANRDRILHVATEEVKYHLNRLLEMVKTNYNINLPSIWAGGTYLLFKGLYEGKTDEELTPIGKAVKELMANFDVMDEYTTDEYFNANTYLKLVIDAYFDAIEANGLSLGDSFYE